MLAISLGAMLTGCVLLYLDYSQYPDRKPEAYTPPAVSGPAARPAAPVGGASGGGAATGGPTTTPQGGGVPGQGK